MLHDELLELVEVGLTPYEALRTATVYPMEHLGEPGTLEVGTIAALMLLERNPLDDIASTEELWWLCARGIGWIEEKFIEE